MMTDRPLRALIVEDNELDAQLLVRELTRYGFDVSFQRVETADAMAAALDAPWDVVLSDFSLPQFSAPAALAVLTAKGRDLPFLIVSGTVDDEAAVEAMRAGAHDFMSKARLARLGPAIDRELREAALRKERAEMQGQLLLSDRMASMGTLAAGVAHEVNNPLAALIANLEFVSQSLPQPLDAEVSEALRDAREAADRVRLVVRDLKVFSRAEESTVGPVDLARAMDSAARMAATEIRHRARLVRDYADVPPVLGIESRLGQVFINLLVNAAHAIPEGRAAQNEIRLVTRPALDGWVVGEVWDTGCGMVPEVRARLFDPFFTTKPAGTGTGLGMSICHRIVRGFGGEIDVDSVPGTGTIVRIRLPAAMRPAPPAAPVPAAPEIALPGRVLLIDDEGILHAPVRRALAPHHVVGISSVSAALHHLADGETYDAILCDLMMPERTGVDFYEALESVAPALLDRVIFVTGGAFTARARAFLATVPNARIEKPFDLDLLRQLVTTQIRKTREGRSAC